MIPEPDYSDTEEENSSEEEVEEEEVVEEEEIEYIDAESEEEDDRKIKKAPQLLNEPKRIDATQRRASRSEQQLFRPEHDLARKKAPPEKPKESRKSVLRTTEDGLIRPKKPSNPYLESSERQKLHKELKFSQKYGKVCANQKSELQMAIEKFTEGKLKRDLAASRQTSLEKILERQARKIEMQEREGSHEVPAWMTRLQMQQHEPWINPKMDEFFRVHAKVLNNHSANNKDNFKEGSDHSDTTSTRSSSLLSANRSSSDALDSDED